MILQFFTIFSIVVVIENHTTNMDLEYVASGTKSGVWYAPLTEVFGDTIKVENVKYDGLKPNHKGIVACQIGTLEAVPKFASLGGMFGTVADVDAVCGYISVRVRCPGKDHIVCCGFRTTGGPSSTNSGAGIQIRGEDGNLDGKGNITGHGTTPTGAVNDAHKLATMHIHHGIGKNTGIDKVQEECRALRVHCEFNNLRMATHTFKFYDGVELNANDSKDEGVYA